ncbi:MAG: exodeoxyribonuclease III [Patescibacteria group bacterium]
MKSQSIISWNVNGLRASYRKGFLDFLNQQQPDIICLQETKIDSPKLLPSTLTPPGGYLDYWSCATEKKGYSGVGILSKIKPLKIKTDFGQSLLSTEGRIIQLEFKNFILLNIYFPNGGGGQARLEYKLKFFSQFLTYIKKQTKIKPILFCGDVNIAHQEMDLARPKENKNSIGFLPEERLWLDKMEVAGFLDVFRSFYPDKVEYSWWDYKTRARDRNVGWRLDYFFADKKLLSKIKNIEIMTEILGSDHAPVKLEFKQ